MEYLNLNTENSFSSISKPINYNYKEDVTKHIE